jgi:hypothetical protein
MYHSLSRDHLYSAYRLITKHQTSTGETKEISGTCFHVKDGEQLYLVTNRHNIELSHKDKKYSGYKISAISIVGYFGRNTFAQIHAVSQNFNYAWSFNSVDNEDVIVLSVTGLKFLITGNQSKPSQLSPINIDIKMLANQADLEKLDLCDLIAFPGYPAEYDMNGERPIMRVGTIASDPSNDYKARGMAPGRRIAYEAHSTHGSSGSPVFALEKGLKLTNGLTGLYHRESMLIGINSGHIVGADERIGQIHAGLSYCYKSVSILECIDRLKRDKLVV